MNINLVLSDFSISRTKGQITEAIHAIRVLFSKKINEVMKELFIRLFRLVIKCFVMCPPFLFTQTTESHKKKGHIELFFNCSSEWIFSGVGYHIVMVKEPHCDVEEISKLIYYYVPSATLEKNVRNELSFILPKEYTHRYGLSEC